MELLTNNEDTIEGIAQKSDEEVLALSLKHPHLFEIILKRYQEPLLRKALSILKSEQDAEDVVQEVFSKIYLHGSKFQVQEGASFKSWAYRILVNTSFTKYQKLKREKNTTASLDPEYYESLADTKMRQFEKEEMIDYVISILSRLPEHLERVLRLHVLEGRPQEEVADMEDISVGAVKTRVHRAKKAFRSLEASLIQVK